jgi:hypothetical protein
MEKIKIFVSYSHEEEDWVSENGKYKLIPWLTKQLSDDAEIWSDIGLKENIGVDFTNTICYHIKQSNIALLLISQDFVSSEFIMDVELPLIQELHERKALKIFPILISELSEVGKDKISWIFELQIYPKLTTALIEYFQRDAEWGKMRVGILNGIHKRIKEIKNNPSPISPLGNIKNSSVTLSNNRNTYLTSQHIIFILSCIIVVMSMGLFYIVFREKSLPKEDSISILTSLKQQINEEIDKRNKVINMKKNEIYSYLDHSDFDAAKKQTNELIKLDPQNLNFRKLMELINDEIKKRDYKKLMKNNIIEKEIENIDSLSSKPIQ